MNGGGAEGGDEIEDDGKERTGEDKKEKVVMMWGYLPGVSPQRSPLLHPAPVRLPYSSAGDTWRDVCGGGCGFAMALSGRSLSTFEVLVCSYPFKMCFVIRTAFSDRFFWAALVCEN
jgi:hypothetical protein